MYATDFLNDRLNHLNNKLTAINKSLAEYGKTMPSEHRKYKLDTMIPNVEKAIEKIKQNPKKYGLCEDCNNKIPIKRLKVLPEVRFCTKCQSKNERGCV